MGSKKGAGSQFEEAIRCIGVDLKPNLGTVKYDDFRIAEGRSGPGSAFESPKKHGGIGRGVQGRYPHPYEMQFLTKTDDFYADFGQGLDLAPAEGD